MLHETHADDDNYNYDDDGAYDELIDISKPTKAGKQFGCLDIYF